LTLALLRLVFGLSGSEQSNDLGIVGDLRLESSVRSIHPSPMFRDVVMLA
jgi:hypothetical protein